MMNWFRRGFDITVALSALVALAPLLGIIAFAVVLADGFPVLFRQVRIGKHGAPFEVMKFRSMRAGVSGARITPGRDTRVTKLGGFLRRYKLDELPQFWNVLVGDMSVIGPRPEVPAFVDPASPAWQEVLGTRPGITDLASLVYRDEEGLLAGKADPEAYYRAVILPDKLALNAAYLRKRSITRDLCIIALTAASSVFPRALDAGRLRHLFLETETT